MPNPCIQPWHPVQNSFTLPHVIKNKDAFIGSKEFVLHMMITQTTDKLFHRLK